MCALCLPHCLVPRLGASSIGTIATAVLLQLCNSGGRLRRALCMPASRSPRRWFSQVQVPDAALSVVRTAPSDAGFVAGDRQDPRPHRLVVVGREPRNAIAPAPHRRGRQRRDCGRARQRARRESCRCRGAGRPLPRQYARHRWLWLAGGRGRESRCRASWRLEPAAPTSHTNTHQQARTVPLAINA